MMTSLEVSIYFNPDLTDAQHKANVDYIDTTWRILKPGGVWGYPAAGAVLRKVEGGWEIIKELKNEPER